jgi:AcrR family transcriptional regulator
MGRKEEILDALIDIFTNQGISGNFTMKELAGKVNIGKSTIYEYFDTKDELLHQAVCRIIETGVKSVYSLEISEEDSFEVSFKKELDFLFSLSVNSSNLLKMINPGFENQMPDESKKEMMQQVNSVRNHYNKKFEVLFQKGISEGVLVPENILTNSLMISSLIVGSIIRLGNLEVKIKEEELKDYIDAVYVTVLRIAK